MNINDPLILEIKGNSLDDGPGIRSVVFFKGCPLSCVWCHNPESKKPVPEICFDQDACIGCTTCMDICRKNALSFHHPFFVNRAICDCCFECVDACPSNALESLGKKMDIREIVNKILPYKPFFETSSGGVTLSGGEPTLNMEFTSQLLIALKAEGIHTIIETCGQFNLGGFKKLILPYLDCIYFDLKIADSMDHKRFCGIGNDLILKNFNALQTLCLERETLLFPRIPLIPGVTDTNKNIEAMGAFLNKLQVNKIELIPYHPVWREKNKKLGVINPWADENSSSGWVGADRIKTCRKILHKAGVKNVSHF